MDIKQVFLVISVIIGLIAPFIYTIEILNKKAKPHRTTRFVLLVITAVSFFSLLAQQNTVAIWVAVVDLIGSAVIFILSFKYGMGTWSKSDLICLTIAGIGIFIWQFTNNPVLGLYAAILADFTGVVPTLVKTYRFPDSESFIYFLIGSIGIGFNLLATKEFTLQSLSYPVYLFIINLCIVFLVLRPRLSKLIKGS